MQQQGTPKFLKFHQSSVRSVAFSPRDRYLFCSGGYDGKVNLYSALRMELLMCYQITRMTLAKNINAVRFTSDGSRILAATTARRLVVVDVERGEQLLAYDNSAFSGRDRTGLATDPSGPNIAVAVSVNGKGLTLLDLRMPLPLDYIHDLHGSVIRDVCFLHSSWPWQSSILTGGTDGLIMSGGDLISAYVPDTGIQEHLKEHKDFPIWKLRYTSNGSTLYSVCDGGILRKYRRYPDHHEFLGEVYRHKGDIQDFDLSSYDEYIVTASKDRSVGVLLLGPPNHGFTEYMELT
ncbi:uncharacterized protein [Neodiprion pinetum]|uniref:Uncharacterized protein LOC107218959 isoform X2 n=1 Tax=Neodiprion lecontei TaxID=441921 RepID=A0A6J0BFJ3_NEOLC|nr:uncharacterized protein LOC107218959 isoform X2 [Neodiprion lecontei]XP_046420217.1 uncharacterized protein LOC124179650 isoform X2 [Neodiprion fabricii]XP_046477168.1 uncharacterized protein LOC124216571 isoform X2 [Neodiprion pinetum]XP_046614215.1 uncharacterized protein LOC124302279 isoform X2 [Neodiprion virginianus]